MKQQNFTRPIVRLLLCALLLNFALLLSACGGPSASGGSFVSGEPSASGGPSASAATMHLKKTEGAVGIADGEGNDIAPAENLGLYSGYTVDTQAESYAWIDLDAVKLAKMDADSAVEIVKDGKHLTVNVQTGSLFFNVIEPLDEDETMEISTSSMLVGIRGTCGWVTDDTAALLEGTVTVTSGEQTVTVNAGEMAVFTAEGGLDVKPFTAASVPAFVRAEVAEDEKLAAEVLDAAGMDLTGSDPAALYADSIARELDEVLYTEWIDLAGDGKPELLVMGIWIHEWDSPSYSDRNVRFLVFPDDPAESSAYKEYDRPLFSEEYQGDDEMSWSLVEADGKKFIEVYYIAHQKEATGPYHAESAQYYGFNDEGKWFFEGVGYTVSVRGDLSPCTHSISVGYRPNEEYTYWDCDLDEFTAVRAKYSEVKQFLYSSDAKEIIVVAP